MRTAVVWSINVAAILAAIPGTLTATHLTLLGIASLFYREPVVAHVPCQRSVGSPRWWSWFVPGDGRVGSPGTATWFPALV